MIRLTRALVFVGATLLSAPAWVADAQAMQIQTLQNQNAQRFAAAADNDSIFVGPENFSWRSCLGHDLSLPDF